MKLNLSVYQREILRMEAGALRGDCATTRKGIKLLDLVELTEKEQEQVGYVATPQGAHWSDTDYRTKVEIGDPEVAELAHRLVRERIGKVEKAQAWITAELREMLNLTGQMGIDFDAVIAEVQKASEAEITEAQAKSEDASKSRSGGRRKK